MTRILLPAVLVLACVGVGATSNHSAHAQAVPADSDALYVKKGCYACHGFVGQGGTTGPALAGTRWPLAAFTAQLRTPANAMPAYSPKVLSDDEVKEIYDFVRKLPAE